MKAGLIVVLFLPENIVLLFSIIYLTFNSWSFLYFDEPTSGLDAENMKLVSETITEQAAAGKIAFVITHDYEFAASLFTSLLVVQDDHSIKRISPDEYRSETLSKIFELEE